MGIIKWFKETKKLMKNEFKRGWKEAEERNQGKSERILKEFQEEEKF